MVLCPCAGALKTFEPRDTNRTTALTTATPARLPDGCYVETAPGEGEYVPCDRETRLDLTHRQLWLCAVRNWYRWDSPRRGDRAHAWRELTQLAESLGLPTKEWDNAPGPSDVQPARLRRRPLAILTDTKLRISRNDHYTRGPQDLYLGKVHSTRKAGERVTAAFVFESLYQACFGDVQGPAPGPAPHPRWSPQQGVRKLEPPVDPIEGRPDLPTGHGHRHTSSISRKEASARDQPDRLPSVSGHALPSPPASSIRTEELHPHGTRQASHREVSRRPASLAKDTGDPSEGSGSRTVQGGGPSPSKRDVRNAASHGPAAPPSPDVSPVKDNVIPVTTECGSAQSGRSEGLANPFASRVQSPSSRHEGHHGKARNRTPVLPLDTAAENATPGTGSWDGAYVDNDETPGMPRTTDNVAQHCPTPATPGILADEDPTSGPLAAVPEEYQRLEAALRRATRDVEECTGHIQRLREDLAAETHRRLQADSRVGQLERELGRLKQRGAADDMRERVRPARLAEVVTIIDHLAAQQKENIDRGMQRLSAQLEQVTARCSEQEKQITSLRQERERLVAMLAAVGEERRSQALDPAVADAEAPVLDGLRREITRLEDEVRQTRAQQTLGENESRAVINETRRLLLESELQGWRHVRDVAQSEVQCCQTMDHTLKHQAKTVHRLLSLAEMAEATKAQIRHRLNKEDAGLHEYLQSLHRTEQKAAAWSRDLEAALAADSHQNQGSLLRFQESLPAKNEVMARLVSGRGLMEELARELCRQQQDIETKRADFMHEDFQSAILLLTRAWVSPNQDGGGETVGTLSALVSAFAGRRRAWQTSRSSEEGSAHSGMVERLQGVLKEQATGLASELRSQQQRFPPAHEGGCTAIWAGDVQSDLRTLEQASAAFENAPADKQIGALYIACQAVATVVGRAGYRGQHMAQCGPNDRRWCAANPQNPSTRPEQTPHQNAHQPDRTVAEVRQLHDRLIQTEQQLREREAQNAALQQQLELRERGAIEQAQRPPRPQWTQQEGSHGVWVADAPLAGDVAPSLDPATVGAPSPLTVEMELDGSLAIPTTPALEAISPDAAPRRTPDPPCPSYPKQKPGGESEPSEPRETAIVPQQGDDVEAARRYGIDHEDAHDWPPADRHPNNSAEPTFTRSIYLPPDDVQETSDLGSGVSGGTAEAAVERTSARPPTGREPTEHRSMKQATRSTAGDAGREKHGTRRAASYPGALGTGSQRQPRSVEQRQARSAAERAQSLQPDHRPAPANDGVPPSGGADRIQSHQAAQPQDGQERTRETQRRKRKRSSGLAGSSPVGSGVSARDPVAARPVRAHGRSRRSRADRPSRPHPRRPKTARARQTADRIIIAQSQPLVQQTPWSGGIQTRSRKRQRVEGEGSGLANRIQPSREKSWDNDVDPQAATAACSPESSAKLSASSAIKQNHLDAGQSEKGCDGSAATLPDGAHQPPNRATVELHPISTELVPGQGQEQPHHSHASTRRATPKRKNRPRRTARHERRRGRRQVRPSRSVAQRPRKTADKCILDQRQLVIPRRTRRSGPHVPESPRPVKLNVSDSGKVATRTRKRQRSPSEDGEPVPLAKRIQPSREKKADLQRPPAPWGSDAPVISQPDGAQPRKAVRFAIPDDMARDHQRQPRHARRKGQSRQQRAHARKVSRRDLAR